jgi:branched-chain amino acid transport system permease protein
VNLFLQVLVTGLATGAVYGLIALGVVVVFSTTRLLNFAQGQFAMIGGITGWYLLTKLQLPYVVALVAVPIVGALVGVAVSAALINPMLDKGADLISVVIATLGLSIVLSQVALLVFGAEARIVPAALAGPPVRFGGVVVTRQAGALIGGSILSLAVFAWIRSRSRLGLNLRAVGANRLGAQIVGINPRRVSTWGFALSGAIACLAGLLVAATSGWTPRMGMDITLMAFIGAIIGGIASPYSAFIGGLMVGLLNQMAQAYFPTFATSLLFLLLILVIAVRPRGLIASSETAAGALRS